MNHPKAAVYGLAVATREFRGALLDPCFEVAEVVGYGKISNFSWHLVR